MGQNTTNIKNALLDMTKSLRDVFKRYGKDTRKAAWERLSNHQGQREISKLIINPNHSLNSFPNLAFKEWLVEMSLSSKQIETYKRAIHSALLNLKHTAPEIFEFDNVTGEPTKIKASFEELKTKLNDRGLIPQGESPNRFTANIKSWAFRSMDDLNDPRFPDEFVHTLDLDRWKEMRQKYQPKPKGGWNI